MHLQPAPVGIHERRTMRAMRGTAMSEIISMEEAKARGLKRYFTGNACLRGHVSERLVSQRSCCECAREREREPEYKRKILEYARKHPDIGRRRSRDCAHTQKWLRENARLICDAEFNHLERGLE